MHDRGVGRGKDYAAEALLSSEPLAQDPEMRPELKSRGGPSTI